MISQRDKGVINEIRGFLLFLVGGDWDLNSGLLTYKVGALHFQSLFCSGYFGDEVSRTTFLD
jgi:hypothetical protein